MFHRHQTSMKYNNVQLASYKISKIKSRVAFRTGSYVKNQPDTVDSEVTTID